MGKWDYRKWEGSKEDEKRMLILANNPSHQARWCRMVNRNNKQFCSTYQACLVLFCICFVVFAAACGRTHIYSAHRNGFISFLQIHQEYSFCLAECKGCMLLLDFLYSLPS